MDFWIKLDFGFLENNNRPKHQIPNTKSQVCIFLIFCIFLNFLTINVFSQTPNKSIDKQFQNIFKKYDMVSLSVVAVTKDNTVYKNNFGYQNLETKIKTNDETYFRVASLSKLYTASLLYKLKSEGKIDFDSNIEKYLDLKIRTPFFPEKEITVLELLMHTASINETNGDYVEFIKKTFSKDYTLKDFLCRDGRIYSDNIFLKYYPPGKKHNYSNLGYIILGTIAEKITGIRFDRLMKKYVLDFDGSGDFLPENIPADKIGTGYSLFNHFHFPEVDNVQKKDSLEGLKTDYKIGENALPLSPQSGLRINLDGLENSLKLILRGERLFLHKDIEFLKRNFIKTSVKGLYQLPGMVMTSNIFPNIELMGHSGSSFGITSDLYFSSEKGIGFAIITSGANLSKDDPQFYRHQRELYDVIYRTLGSLSR